MDLQILTNAKIVTSDEVFSGTLIHKNGKIIDIQKSSTSFPGGVDVFGDFLIPGLIELHTDNLERHLEPRPKVTWPHTTAILAHDAELASAGITTVFDAMRIGSIDDGKSGYVKYARSVSKELMSLRQKGALKISHFLHLRAEVCSETLIEEFSEFNENDRVGLVSLMDHTPGQRQFRDLEALRNYVQKKRGMTDQEFVKHIEHLFELRSKFGDAHEEATVKEAARLGAVLASHDDTTSDQVKTSSKYGVRLAEFPTTLEAARECRKKNIAVMMGAPNLIRGGSHSGNIAAQELAAANLLDIVSSDYVPYALVSSAFMLAELWHDIPRAIATVTKNPAQAVGLTDRGTLALGMNADIVRVGLVDQKPVVRGVWSRGRQVA